MPASSAPPLASPTPDLIRAMTAVVGEPNAITDPEAQSPYLREWRDLYRGRSPLVLRPGSTEEVSKLLALANAARVGIVPQSGNTGLVGGQIPDDSGREIVLSTSRLSRVRSIDAAGQSMIVEAGVTLAAARAAAAACDRLFPLSMASEGSCCIGGNLATNAGGVAVLAHGTARQQALGLEVVLADGRIWNGLRALKKDNTGYDLRDLFIGSEGTLGIITAACLRLAPKPAETAVALVALRDTEKLLALFSLAEAQADTTLTAFEFMSARAMEFARAHIPGVRVPFDRPYPWYVLIEISALTHGTAGPVAEHLLSAALDEGLIETAVLAGSEREKANLWRLREGLSEAQKPEGGSIKHDISVPVALIPAFLDEAAREVERVVPGARPVPFGHFGDGNVHYNVSQPIGADKAAFLALWEPMTEAVHAVVRSLGGSISAEHGIGRLKRAELARVKSVVELDMMRAVKRALDPNGILNAGRVV